MAPEKGTPPGSKVDAWADKWRDRWFDQVTVGAAHGDWSNESADYRVWVMHPDYPGWNFMLTFSASGALVGFEVVASSDQPDRYGHSESAPPLTARFLRKLPLGEIEAEARRYQLDQVDGMKSWVSETLVSRHAAAFTKDPRPGRRGRSDILYAEVAALYVDLCRAGSHRPKVDLADRLGYSVAQVSNVLKAARRKGLLTAAPPGRHGGVLTPTARDLLKADS